MERERPTLDITNLVEEIRENPLITPIEELRLPSKRQNGQPAAHSCGDHHSESIKDSLMLDVWNKPIVFLRDHERANTETRINF